MRSLLVTSEDLLVFVDADLSRGSEILPAGGTVHAVPAIMVLYSRAN